MRYSQSGILKDTRPWGKMFVAGAAAVTLAIAMFASTFAATAVPTKYTEYPFTDSELTQWSVDRSLPSGGFSSVDDFEGRDDVLQMNIDAGAQNPVQFYKTEGLKREAQSADTVRADLYVDSTWSETEVRAGLWGVGEDESDVITAYPIVEYTTEGAYEGWRVFNDELGTWTNLSNAATKDGWNTLELKYNSGTTTFDVYINGDLAGSSVATGSTELDAVILNNFNYGLAGQDYSVNWSNFALGNYVKSADDCKNGNFATLGFKNQGSCVSFVKANANASFKREQ